MAEWLLLRVVLWLIVFYFLSCTNDFVVLRSYTRDFLYDLRQYPVSFDHLTFCHLHSVFQFCHSFIHHHTGISCYLLLLLFGNISLNPGPILYPCTVRGKSVKSNQRALLCDDCGLWFHCRCCGVDMAKYNCFQVQVDFSWICPPCFSKALPFNNCSVLSCSDLDCSSSGIDITQFTYTMPTSPFPRHSFLKVTHFNCRSLLASLDEVYLFMKAYSVDIMTLSEIWLDETISDFEVYSDTYYTIVRHDRNRWGGGIAIILSKVIPFCLYPELSEGSVESLWVQLFPGGKRAIWLCYVYRSPSDYHFLIT